LRADGVYLVAVLLVGGCEAHDKVLPFDGPSVLDASARDAGALDGALPEAGGDPDDQPRADASSRDAGEGGAAASDAGEPPADPECDATGLWAVKQLTRSVALGLGQFANYWYLFQLEQHGEVVRVVRHVDCDIYVEGSVVVRITAATRRALHGQNRQTSRGVTMRRLDAGHCALRFDRFWSVRGADEARFSPTPRSSAATAAELRSSLPLPSSTRSDGAEDVEGDGQLGIAWQITGIASGTRNTIQRDVTEWTTDETHTIAPALDFTGPLVLRGYFDNDENVMHATSSLLASVAVADQTAEHRVTFQFLGRNAEDTRAKAVLDDDDDVMCQRIVALIPREASL
jgi:hypothetical protein